MTTGPSDAALLDAHLAGDADAFAELFGRNRDMLWAVALRVTGNPEDAADALQDAMVSALRSAARFEHRSAVRTWLYRIVVNAGLDRLRRGASHPVTPLGETDVPSPGDQMARVVDRLDLTDALSRLTPGQRVAVLLVDAHGLPVAEVAEILEVPEGTVKSRCSRARAQLAEILRSQHAAAPGNEPAPVGVPSPEPPVHGGNQAGATGGRRREAR